MFQKHDGVVNGVCAENNHADDDDQQRISMANDAPCNAFVELNGSFENQEHAVPKPPDDNPVRKNTIIVFKYVLNAPARFPPKGI